MYYFTTIRNINNLTKCGGWDSNPRIPSKPDLKSGAFDLAGQPSQIESIF